MPLSIPKTGGFIDNGHHQLRIRDLLFLGVASPRINEANYLIIPHVACSGMLKAGVRVSGVARYYNCHPPATQHLRDCYQATRTVKGRHRPGQLRMATDIKTATNVDYIDDIYIDDIRSRWLPTLPDE